MDHKIQHLAASVACVQNSSFIPLMTILEVLHEMEDVMCFLIMSDRSYGMM